MSLVQLGFDPKLRAAIRQTVLTWNIGAAAADASEDFVVFVSDRKAVLRRVSWVPHDDVTGANTNTFHLNVINRGSDNTGTTELANIDYVSGTDASTNIEEVFTAAADTQVSAGDVIVVQRELVGTGQAMPEGTFVVIAEVQDFA